MDPAYLLLASPGLQPEPQKSNQICWDRIVSSSDLPVAGDGEFGPAGMTGSL